MTESKFKRVSKRLAILIFALIVCVILLIYTLMTYDIFKSKRENLNNLLVMSRFTSLVSCAAGDGVLPGLPFACKQGLSHLTFDRTEINWINLRGDLQMLAGSDEDLASVVLPRMINMGANVDVVPPSITNDDRQWTLLHGSVFSAPWWTKLLLENDADVHKKDAAGRTPLALAKELLAKKPENTDWAAIVELLEKHESIH